MAAYEARFGPIPDEVRSAIARTRNDETRISLFRVVAAGTREEVAWALLGDGTI